MRVPAPRPAQLGTGALVVAALALGQALDSHLPDGKDSARLHEAPVAIGDTVSIRAGDVTPTEVEGAMAVLRDTESIRAQGVGLVLRLDFTARGETTALTYAQYRGGDGSRIELSTIDDRSQIACPAIPPGITQHCTVVVEVDPASLPGATLGVSVDANDPRYDEMAVVDLDVDAADVERWQATEQVEVVTHEVDGL